MVIFIRHLALIREIQKKTNDAKFLYIGTEKGLESKLVTRENIPFKSIYITGFKRKFSFENVKTILRFIKGVNRSKKMLKDLKQTLLLEQVDMFADLLFMQPAKLGIPTIIHEQNSIPGLTNKFLSRYVERIAVCFEEAKISFPMIKWF